MECILVCGTFHCFCIARFFQTIDNLENFETVLFEKELLNPDISSNSTFFAKKDFLWWILLKSDLWWRPEILIRGAHREKSSTTPLKIAAAPDHTLFIIVSALGE